MPSEAPGATATAAAGRAVAGGEGTAGYREAYGLQQRETGRRDEEAGPDVVEGSGRAGGPAMRKKKKKKTKRGGRKTGMTQSQRRDDPG